MACVFFWYMFAYTALIWNMAIVRGHYSWEIFFPVKIIAIFIAWLYGSINYGMAHKKELKGKNKSVLSLRKNMIFFIGAFLSALIIIFLSKILNMNLLWLMF